MDKIIIEDGDYCKNCKLVNRYNELIDINNEHQKINGELREKIKLLNKMNEENYEKYCNELKVKRKAIEYIEWQEKNPQYDNVWRPCECKSLIDILKGDSNE